MTLVKVYNDKHKNNSLTPITWNEGRLTSLRRCARHAAREHHSPVNRWCRVKKKLGTWYDFRSGRGMSPESKSRLAGSYRYKNAFRSISHEPSTLRQKMFRPFYTILNFPYFLLMTYFVTLIFLKLYYLQNYLFEYLFNRLLFRKNTYDQTCRASYSLHIVTVLSLILSKMYCVSCAERREIFTKCTR